jgi:hypothetical protein
VQGGAAACVSVNVAPAIVSVAMRDEPVEFAAYDTPTMPFPDPEAPDAIVANAAGDVAVQAQPAPAVTPTLSDPAALDTDALVESSWYVQLTPDCVSVRRRRWRRW